MRAGRIQFTRGQKGSNKFLSWIPAIVLLVVGLIFCVPFVFHVIFMEQTSRYMTFFNFISIWGIVMGLPMFFMGVISILSGKSKASPSTYNEHDVGRIRHAVETDKMNGK